MLSPSIRIDQAKEEGEKKSGVMTSCRKSSLLAASLLLMCHLLLKFDASSASLRRVSLWAGACGNSRYDSTTTTNRSSLAASNRSSGKPSEGESSGEISHRSDETSTRPEFRKKPIKPFPAHKTRLGAQRALIDRLAAEPVIVKLHFVYDKSFAPESKLQEHLRALTHQLQLIYEQPEMSQRIKFNFVVVSVKASSVTYPHNYPADDLLAVFTKGPDLNPDADLNVLLFFRTVWTYYGKKPKEGQKPSKILGLAYVGTFCRPNDQKTLLLYAPTVGSTVSFAHEISHSLNCEHDGHVQHPIESKCRPNTYIMSPALGPHTMRWSPCTVDCVFENLVKDADVANCLYDPQRIANALPFNKEFDFTPVPTNPNRFPLPGIMTSIDEQCKRALDVGARSALTQLGKNGESPFDTCQDLLCIHETEPALFEIGPAPSGSRCNFRGGPSSDASRCYNAECVNFTKVGAFAGEAKQTEVSKISVVEML